MQFPFRTDQVLQPDPSGITIIQGHQLSQKLKSLKADTMKHLAQIITSMGVASAKAQALKQVITTFEKFVGTDNRIYLKVEGNKVLGLLRVGEKNLFHRDYIGSIKEIKPTCILDFYVHQSCQRSGVGKEIFQRFLIEEQKHPAKLAYDRPSEKLINFLKKHYGLAKYIPQNNNFVVFNQYFEQIKQPIVPPPSKIQIVPKDLPIKQQKQPPKPQQQIPPVNPKRDHSLRQIKQPQLKQPTKQSLKLHSQPKSPSKQDTIDQLRKQFATMSTKDSKQPKKYELSSPWAETFIDRAHFRTTSNTYGSHYK